MSAHMSCTMTEAEMVQLVRNALLVAGGEIGPTGDHWPIIQTTINGIMRDWEELQIERTVLAEMKKHLFKQLEAMEIILPTCDQSVQDDVAPKLKELRDVYEAYFTDISLNDLVLEDAEAPIHVKRAEAIMDILEEKEDA
ncbi:MAG: hypothetical protein HGA90_05640 [Alphaproteobacteria bacterium]|nr:hypothetical protein [Alphaproteobacteria bacterium]